MPFNLLRYILLVVSLAGASLGIARHVTAEAPVTVFAAASLKSALDEIAEDYPSPLQISYGGSSTLARQIQYGAPAEVFISANVDWMDVLERDGLIETESRKALLTNRLVLIGGPDTNSTLKIAHGFDLAGALNGDYLAMALIDAVPAGIYGRAALRSLGVWDSVAPYVAQADNVRAALMLVAIGEAPYGIVYATDAAAARVKIIDTFPADSHPPILYPVARISGAGKQAKALVDYLSTPAAREIFVKHGFGIPADGT